MEQGEGTTGTTEHYNVRGRSLLGSLTLRAANPIPIRPPGTLEWLLCLARDVGVKNNREPIVKEKNGVGVRIAESCSRGAARGSHIGSHREYPCLCPAPFADEVKGLRRMSRVAS